MCNHFASPTSYIVCMHISQLHIRIQQTYTITIISIGASLLLYKENNCIAIVGLLHMWRFLVGTWVVRLVISMSVL